MNYYYSLTFLWVFLPLVLLIWQLAPQKHRGKVLLAGSWIFLGTCSPAALVFLLLTTVTVYFTGLRMGRAEEVRQRKRIYLAGLLVPVLLLAVLRTPGIPEQFLLIARSMKPVPALGVCVCTMLAVSYLTEVYRGNRAPETSLGKLSLYLGFFPQLAAGPICRYADTADTLWAGGRITERNLTRGLQRCLLGIFKKLVIADRLALLTDPVFRYPGDDGGMLAVAMVLYTVQLYMALSGTADLAIGIGEIFGVTMPENFRQPFFSRTLSEFWSRWQITLGRWLGGYVCDPVSGFDSLGRLLITWVLVGLWYGTGWQYVGFGLYFFCLFLLGRLLEPIWKRLAGLLRLHRDHWLYQGMQILRTGLLVSLSGLFLRGESLAGTWTLFRILFTRFTLVYVTPANLAAYGLELRTLAVLALAAGLIFVMSLLQEKGISLRNRLERLPAPIRWMFWYALIFGIIFFGTYGVGYVPVSPLGPWC